MNTPDLPQRPDHAPRPGWPEAPGSRPEAPTGSEAPRPEGQPSPGSAGQGRPDAFGRTDAFGRPAPQYPGAFGAESGPAAPDAPGAPGTSGTSAPEGPGGFGTGGTGGFGTGGPGEPNGPAGGASADRRRRGPGWGGVLSIALVAALLGGGIGAGASYVMSASGPTTSFGTPAPAGKDSPDTVAADGLDWTEVARNASPSVVAIQVGVGGRLAGQGSGFVYDAANGYIITNNHVVAEADTAGGAVQVVLAGGGTVNAEIVGRDPETDIAVIRLEQVPEGVPALQAGDSSGLEVGDPVMALGNPLGLADTVTTGIVSALNRPVTTTNVGENATEQEVALTITSAIQTDAAINPGNSGGPLVNAAGEVIGVNSSAATLQDQSSGGQGGSIGIGFAIPIAQATNIADQLIENGTATHPFLGVTISEGRTEIDGISRSSALVAGVEDGSAAAQAGIEKGDHVVAVNGTAVNSLVSLQALIRSHAVGETVTITVVRGDRTLDLDATLPAES